MRTLVKTCLFLSLFSLTIFSSDFYFPYIVSKVFPFRFFIELGFIAWLIDIYFRRTLRFRFSEPIVIAMSVFAVALSASTLFGVDPLFSFWSNFERSEGLFSFLHYFVFFFLVVDTFSLDDYYRFIKFALLLSPLIAYYKISDFLDFKTYSFGRAWGVFGNPSYLAAFLIFIFGFGLLLILKNREIMQHTKDHLLWLENALWMVILLVDIPAFVLTQTRAAYIGLVVGIVVFFLFLARKGIGSQKRIAYSVLVFLSVLFVVFGIFVFKTKPSFVTGLLNPSSIIFRVAVWGSAWSGFLDKPLFGYGMENFSVAFNRHYNPIHSGGEVWFDHAHDVLLELLATTGIIGFLAYLSIFIVFFRVYFLFFVERRPPVEVGLFLAIPTAYFIQNLALFDTLSSYVCFFFFLGYARMVFLKEIKKEGELMYFRFHPVILTSIIMFFIILTSFGVYGNVMAYERNTELLNTYKVSRQTTIDLGVQSYKKLLDMSGYLGKREVMKELAVFIHEWVAQRNSSPFTEGEVRGLESSFSIMDNFLRTDPLYLNGYYTEGIVYNLVAFKSGDHNVFKRAEIVFRTMNNASQNRIEILNLLAENLAGQKKYDEALMYAMRIIALRPDMEVGHKLAGILYDKMGKRDEAKKELEKAIQRDPKSAAVLYLKGVK